MPKHFNAIGFGLDGPDKLKDLAHTAIRQGEAFSSGHPDLPEAAFLWDLGRGLQMWVYARRSSTNGGDGYDITACLPGFRVEEALQLRAYRLEISNEGSGEVFVRGRLPNGAEIRAILLNMHANDHLKPSGLDLNIHLAGLALEASIHDPDDGDPPVVEMEDNDGKLKTVDSLFAPIDRDCHCRILGIIDGVREVVNFHTGARLWALGVRTSDFSLPVLAPGGFFSRPPLDGLRVNATIWLQAQISDSD